MASRFWVGGTGTWDNADTTHWSATSNGAGGASVPAAADTVTFDALSGGGTVTVAATINASNTLVSITCGAFTGTLAFNTNNPSITLTTAFSITGTGTRTINLGSGTFTFTATSGNIWDAGTVTNLTFSGASSTFTSSVTPSNSRTFVLGGQTYGTINIANSGLSNGNLVCTLSGGSSVITTLNLTAPLQLAFNNGMTITNAFNASGTAFNNVILFNNTTTKATITLTNGGTMQWVAIDQLTFVGSPTATNSFDLGSTSGIVITGPSGGGSVGVIGS